MFQSESQQAPDVRKAKKTPMSQLKEIKQEEIPLTGLGEGNLVILLKPPASCLRTADTQEGSLLYLV